MTARRMLLALWIAVSSFGVHADAQDAELETTYFWTLATAQAAIQRGDVVAAKRALSRSPESRRDWVWGLALAATDESDATFFPRRAWGLAANPAETLLAIPAHFTVELRSLRTFERIHELPTEGASSADFSPDGRLLVANGRSGVAARIWNVETGTLVRTIESETHASRLLRFTPDGRSILSTGSVLSGAASTGRGSLAAWTVGGDLLWEVATGRRVALSMDIDPTGRFVVIGALDGAILVHRVDTGELVRNLGRTEPMHGTNPEWVVHAVALSPDGAHLAVAVGATIRILEWRTGAEVERLDEQIGTVRALTFSADGRRLVSGGHDKTVRYWSLRCLEEDEARDDVERLTIPAGERTHGARPGQLPPPLEAVASGNGVALGVGRMRVLRGHVDAVRSVLALSDGRVISASEERGVKVWPATPRPIFAATTRNWLEDVAIDSTGTLFAIADGSARVFDATTGAAVLPRQDPFEHVGFEGGPVRNALAVAFAPDEPLLASGEGVVWDLRTRQALFGAAARSGGATGLAFSPDGALLAAAWPSGAGVRVLDAATGALRRELSGDGRVAFGPAGELAVSDRGWLRICDPLDGTERLKMPVMGGDRTVAMAFDPTGRRIAGARGAPIFVWDTVGGEQLAELRGHEGAVQDLAFDPEGRWLVSVALDGSMRVWSIEHGAEIYSMRLGWGVRGVAMTRDASALAVAFDKVAAVLDVVDPRSKRAAALLADLEP